MRPGSFFMSGNQLRKQIRAAQAEAGYGEKSEAELRVAFVIRSVHAGRGHRLMQKQRRNQIGRERGGKPLGQLEQKILTRAF